MVTDYLDRAGLTESLDALGFQTVGYGCTTCIGNSGPLPETVAKAVTKGDLVASAVLSGNRNFEGRINPLVKANYLASPPLVVAYALAGTTDIDLINEPLGIGTRRHAGLPEGHLAHAGRSRRRRCRARAARDVSQSLLERVRIQRALEQDRRLRVGDLYAWDASSTYIQEPPFLIDSQAETTPVQPIMGAACWSRWAIRSRRTTSRRPDRSPPRARPGSS